MINPKISIIIPVYNVENYLDSCLNSLKNQTFQEFEVICVDDGSTDTSPDILHRYAQEDDRFTFLTQNNHGAGTARNTGLAAARGEYVIFLDSDDLFSSTLLEKSYTAIVEYQADIAAFNFTQFDEDGSKTWRQGIHNDWLPADQKVFNYTDCPDLIMSIINPTPWNKLYRKNFILENNLKFEEISSSNDITFAAVSVACAKRITFITDSLVEYRIGHSGTVTSTKSKKLDNVIVAVTSAVEQAKKLPYGKEIKNSIYRFTIDNYIFALKHNVTNFDDEHVQQFYEYIHEVFCQEEFTLIQAEDLHNDLLFRDFCIVQKHNYETMKTLLSRKLIVSFTSYPARINSIPTVLESIYTQTYPADEIILWLAEDQFPNKEHDLPVDLQQLIMSQKLTVKWCDDLKPHKKYFYALQEYSDALIITIDDDLIYSPHTFGNLYQSYLLYPDAVSTVRAHLIAITESNEILPYEYWIKETDACLYIPSMQLLATGGAGTLYPPGLFLPELFNKEVILEHCLWADDLWLKVMELLSDVPVVVAQPFEGLRYLPGSQETALCHQNVDQNQNDIQLAQIREWLTIHYGKDILLEKLTTLEIGEKLLGVSALCRCFSNERKAFRKNMNTMQRRLQNAYKEKSEINAKLQRTYREKSEINAKLQKTYREKAERGIRIKELEAENASLKSPLHSAKAKIKHYSMWPLRKAKQIYKKQK